MCDSHRPIESRLKLMDKIHITMPDGAIREVPLGTMAAEVAQQISPRLAKEALVARIAPIHQYGDGLGAWRESGVGPRALRNQL